MIHILPRGVQQFAPLPSPPCYMLLPVARFVEVRTIANSTKRNR